MGDSGTGTVWTNWQWRGLLGVGALLLALDLFANLAGLALLAGRLPVGDVGQSFAETSNMNRAEVTHVVPGGPGAAAGIAQGDVLHRRPENLTLAMFPPLPGERIAVTAERGGEQFHTTVIATARQASPSLADAGANISIAIGQIATALLGAVLLVRGRRNRAASLLGLTMLFLGNTIYFAPWVPDRAIAIPLYFLTVSLPWLGGLVPLVALEISGGAASPRQARLVRGLALGIALGLAALLYLGRPLGLLGMLPMLTWSSYTTALYALVYLSQLSTILVFAWNYRRNDPVARNRIKIVLLAVVLYILWDPVFNQALRAPGWAGVVIASLVGLLPPALLAYSVLRQKLFDLNFALNRTLVYGAVSFVLLAAFGIAKWVIEHLIPESWHAGSEYYSVGIALGLFLVLHRVHDAVERTVERFLFSPWHRNEEALRRFVTAAGHFDETDVLCRAFAAEASRFAKGAGAALYVREVDGSYALGCGSLGGALPRCAGDDLVLALMRADRRPVRTGGMASALPGALAVPMLDHGKLAGFLLLDGKPDGTDYRPDEIDVLGWAAHQVGLDLQAMRASELEAENAGLNETVAGLRGTIAQLSADKDQLGALLADLAPRARRGA